MEKQQSIEPGKQTRRDTLKLLASYFGGAIFTCLPVIGHYEHELNNYRSRETFDLDTRQWAVIPKQLYDGRFRFVSDGDRMEIYIRQPDGTDQPFDITGLSAEARFVYGPYIVYVRPRADGIFEYSARRSPI